MAAGQEAEAGFAIGIYDQPIIESNVEHLLGDPDALADASSGGLVDPKGGITEKGWDQLNKDVERIESNSMRWLKRTFLSAQDQGHLGDELVGSVQFDPHDPDQAHLIDLAANNGRQERIDMTDASFGNLAHSVFDGVSNFGASVLGGGITFHDVKREDMEAVEATLERERMGPRPHAKPRRAQEAPNRRLDAFTAAFIEAALWSTTGDDDEPLDKNYSASDIDPATLAAMERECADFQEKYGDLIRDDESAAIDKWGRWELAGHEFWLTMNGHGAGFGDGNFPKHDDELYEAAKTYRGFDLYVGDDGVIYASGHEPPLPVSEVRRPILRPRPAVRSAHRAVRHPPRPHYAGEVRDMPNIFWRDIPPGSKVELVGHSYVVTKPDGTKASAYWSGNDAAVAQRTLDSMAKAGAKGQRLPLPRPRGFNSALRRKR